jgi:hypothetical protein
VDAFAAAIGAVFADPNIARAGLWRAGGSGVPRPVRVVLRSPDSVAGFGGARLRVETVRFEVRTSEVEALADGDTFEVDGLTWTVQGAPARDAARLVWMAEAVVT